MWVLAPTCRVAAFVTHRPLRWIWEASNRAGGAENAHCSIFLVMLSVFTRGKDVAFLSFLVAFLVAMFFLLRTASASDQISIGNSGTECSAERNGGSSPLK